MSTIDSRQKRSGFIAVLTAVMMIVLLGFAAIAVDYASIVSKEQQLRRAVDHTAAAALRALSDAATNAAPAADPGAQCAGFRTSPGAESCDRPVIPVAGTSPVAILCGWDGLAVLWQEQAEPATAGAARVRPPT